jgi:hypothetical protein
MADPSETTQISRVPPGGDEQELLAAIRDLASQVGTLQGELHALRSQEVRLPEGEGERAGWEETTPSLRESGAWVRSLDAPTYRRLSIPWLALEIAFLVGVAVLAAVADLDPPVIAGVMALAWVVVALAEWAAARSARRSHALRYGVFTPAPPAAAEDPSWLEPPSERTALDVGDPDSGTVVRLPPSAD